ncbi:MAG: class II aldolase/adducin family protein [Rhodospirillales bacterium]
MKTADARIAVAAAYRDLGRIGLIVGSSGNVSVRTRKGMAITPSGGDPNGAEPVDIVAMALDGDVSGKGTPSSEWSMHAAIYKMKPDAACVVHAHADACTALACLHESLPGFHYMVLRFGGNDVPCAPYVTFGTPALADAATEALTARSACLLANHGMILHARDVATAVADAVLLESLCRQYLLARSAGTPRNLSSAELAAARERFKTYGPARGR